MTRLSFLAFLLEFNHQCLFIFFDASVARPLDSLCLLDLSYRRFASVRLYLAVH